MAYIRTGPGDPYYGIWQSQTATEGLYSLGPHEQWWIDRRDDLKQAGYTLRPRYQPNWHPSWLSSSFIPMFCEDSVGLRTHEFIDAVRDADGAHVIIKKQPVGSMEHRVLTFLDKVAKQQKRQNPAVALIDVIEDRREPNLRLLVTPLLRNFEDPKFIYVSEVMQFMNDALMGLAWMHQQGVAHRDCSFKSIGMDGSKIAPDGFHPIDQKMAPDFSGPAKFMKRMDVGEVKYYYLNFDSALMIEPTQPRVASGWTGRLPVAPELVNSRHNYDPFALDVFLLGTVFQYSLLRNYANLAFLQTFVNAMRDDKPHSRPTAANASMIFKRLHDGEIASKRIKRNTPLIWNDGSGRTTLTTEATRSGLVPISTGNSNAAAGPSHR